MDADSRSQTRVASGGDNMTPSWAPDGEWIAFVKSATRSPGIYKVRPNGSGLCKVVSTSGFQLHGAPAWSPSADSEGNYWIVYADRLPGQLRPDLFAVISTCNAGNRRQLTDTPELSFADQSTIAFAAAPDVIYVADVSQPWSLGQPTVLLDANGSVRFPAWRPVRWRGCWHLESKRLPLRAGAVQPGKCAAVIADVAGLGRLCQARMATSQPTLARGSPSAQPRRLHQLRVHARAGAHHSARGRPAFRRSRIHPAAGRTLINVSTPSRRRRTSPRLSANAESGWSMKERR